MYFYLKSGKQHLDLGSDLVLTYDHSLVTAQIKKCAPAGVHNASYVLLRGARLHDRLKVCYKVCKFVLFGRPIR